MTTVRTAARIVRERSAVAAGMRLRLAARDTALVAAGITFYGGIAVVPMLLLGLRLTTLLLGEETVVGYGDAIAGLLPGAAGAPGAVRTLFDAGTHLGWLGGLVAILPATFYGEGMRRALLVYEPVRETFVGWRGRASALPVLIITPLLTIPVLVVGNALASVNGGIGAGAFRVWLGFVTIWLVLAVPIGWTYRVVAPTTLSRTAVVIGALTTASFVSGFLQGYVLFLAVPIDWSGPFGGLEPVGAAVATVLWLFLLHIIVLIGWVFTLECDRVSEREVHSERDGSTR
ncbi:YihY/virulence factor BrkB family protein [Rhodococcus sp. BP-349]|uniref:YhjD/YihY/BrkB family envelope integrity protein n=1 Tax=unclassified Rhodococcus (in: high G+C Gram-positive bacteria) TaxID=192944 RepID=UPI001C9AAA96|nr:MULTISPECIES: YhjD/YihY/BrkB family envelope integrity protein [unclassified Rhodococcus (in: high G+C Gram-positive bacteria)]MBY6540458.1 YihY/virulence factor BrkB family protein [Rhodococcus sp. BP-363]MBY6545517.1 YihY/virulence factor BrkB family protein [Rhodococcus sp. BP-369]MBY6564747.1 YihY/virulence factor BrkB family protein [Rhodococcus sp. BP-370]MBY6578317.1 YihY/virulence factor BrkB family protein [Rhodococcus sp. BP-364]MBY6587618.1 YihY/virulence factor BrkB family prote